MTDHSQGRTERRLSRHRKVYRSARILCTRETKKNNVTVSYWQFHSQEPTPVPRLRCCLMSCCPPSAFPPGCLVVVSLVGGWLTCKSKNVRAVFSAGFRNILECVRLSSISLLPTARCHLNLSSAAAIVDCPFLSNPCSSDQSSEANTSCKYTGLM